MDTTGLVEGGSRAIGGTVRAVLVDDNERFLGEVARFLTSDPLIDVVGRAASGEEALVLVPRLAPDVVLMDLAMPGLSGLETTRQLKAAPNPPLVVILTLYQGSEYGDAARDAGADAFVSKAALADRLLPMVHDLFREPPKALADPKAAAPPAPASLPSDRLAPAEAADGLARGVLEATGLATSVDFSRQPHLEEELRQAQKMEAVGRLAGGIVHDFSNLLSAVLGYCDLALRRVEADPKTTGYLLQIRSGAESAANLTRQLLAFSRKSPLQLAVLNLNDTLLRVERLVRRLIGEDVEMVTTLSADLGWVQADAGQMDQIILNLAVNARDAMPNGGVLEIATTNVDLDENDTRAYGHLRPGPYVRLSVKDTGMGMDLATSSRIFEPFFTTKGEGKGTGLGLATVDEIVKQSGGLIRVTSRPGLGTTFAIDLPRVNPPSR